MSSWRTIAGVSGAVVLLICTCPPLFAGKDAAEACSLLTQARLSEVLGVQVGAGVLVSGFPAEQAKTLAEDALAKL